jgi:hypothetical protein
MLDYAARFEARVDGVTFSGRRFDWTPGVYVKGVEGLLGGGPTEHESIASGVGDGLGEFDVANVRTGPRIIVLAGFVYERTMFGLGHKLRQLDGVLGRGPGVFSWTEYGETFWTRVRRGASSPPRRRGATGFADFTIRFRAPSQAYFGEGHAAGPGTSLQLINRGNDDALPVVTVTGSMPTGYRLIGGGATYAVVQALAAGQTHRVDMTDRILLRDGVAQPGGASSPKQIAVPAFGTTTLQLIPNSGTGQASAAWSDTFN